MIIIGFGFKAGVGKDTAGNYIRDTYGWGKASFASNLKNCCKEVFGLSEIQVEDQVSKEAPFSSPVLYSEPAHSKIVEWMSVSLKDIEVFNFKFDSSIFDKVLYTPRDIMQFVGTEVMRSYNPMYHAITCFNSMSGGFEGYSICDVRFPNEALAVIERNGFCVKINRKTYLSLAKNKRHRSEVALDGWDGWYSNIDNYGHISELYNKLDTLVGGVRNARRK